MATGKDETEPIVFDPVVVLLIRLGNTISELVRYGGERGIKPCPPTERVNGLEATRRNQPGTGVSGNTLDWPALHRCRERLLQCFFRQIKVAQQSNQGCQNSPGLVAEDLLNQIRPQLGKSATRQLPVIR
jgi:hypothetical protein